MMLAAILLFTFPFLAISEETPTTCELSPCKCQFLLQGVAVDLKDAIIDSSNMNFGDCLSHCAAHKKCKGVNYNANKETCERISINPITFPTNPFKNNGNSVFALSPSCSTRRRKRQASDLFGMAFQFILQQLQQMITNSAKGCGASETYVSSGYSENQCDGRVLEKFDGCKCKGYRETDGTCKDSKIYCRAYEEQCPSPYAVYVETGTIQNYNCAGDPVTTSVPGCECLVRDDPTRDIRLLDGQCIPVEECSGSTSSSCGKYQQYNPTTSTYTMVLCDGTTVTKQGPGCECALGYRYHDAKCIPLGECPVACPANELLSSAPYTDRFCDGTTVNFDAQTGCRCVDGYARVTGFNSDCVPQSQCDAKQPTASPNPSEEVDANGCTPNQLYEPGATITEYQCDAWDPISRPGPGCYCYLNIKSDGTCGDC